MKHLKNLQYILRHKWYVFLCGLKRRVPLWQLIIHDLSKFSRNEWFAYANYFFGNKKDKVAFDKAWNHHQKYNKHHWQYWLIIEDNGITRALEMPENYRREMLADWDGAGLAKASMAKRSFNTKEWYIKNKDIYMFHPKTRRLIEQDLDI